MRPLPGAPGNRRARHLVRPGDRGDARLGGGLRRVATPPRARARPRSGGGASRHPLREAPRQLPVLPPALRGTDAQATAPGGDRRACRNDARQSQQPRARRRSRDRGDGARGGGRARRDAPPPRHRLGHLTSSGTVANLEALFVARELHRGRGVACSDQAHYTHRRMCHLLDVPCEVVASRRRRAHRPRRARAAARRGRWAPSWSPPAPPGSAPSTRSTSSSPSPAATRCASTSTPPTAASSPSSPGPATPRCRGRRCAPSRSATRSSSTRTSTGSSPTAAARCSSATRRSPGSTRTTRRTPTTPPRAGTSARSAWSAPAPAPPRPALWLTLQAFPLTPGGLGAVLARRAPRRPALVGAARGLRGCSPRSHRPELDIVTLAPRSPRSLGALDAACQGILERGMTEADPVFLSLLRLDAGMLRRRSPGSATNPDRRGCSAAC